MTLPLGTLVSITAAFLLLSGCSQKPPISVIRDTGQMGPVEVPILKISATVDKVTVNSLTINRGNCTWGAGHGNKPPIDVAFGNTITIVALGCNITEVSVNTSQGDYTFNFN